MPDFDPETIPTLDDVIEPVTPDLSDSENKADEIDPVIVEENESVLFTAEPVIDFIGDADIEETELESETSFDFVEEENEDAELNLTDASLELAELESADEEDSENFESALIDYNAEEAILSTETESHTEEIKTDEPPVIVQSPTLISEADLQSISDEIVLQLMPELEQRLRVLVQQILQEKLPPEIIQFETTSSTEIDD